MERKPAYRNPPLFLRKSLRIIQYQPDDIIYLEAADDYVYVVTNNGTHLLRATLKEVERKLTYSFFCRVHRSYIVNIQHVNYVEKDLINLTVKEIPLHRDYYASFLEKLLVL